MTEVELKTYLQKNYPVENEACEWKEFRTLKHSFSGQAGDDIISYISAISNMEGGVLIIGVKDKSLDITGIQDFHNHNAQNIILRLLAKCSNLDSENFRIEETITSDSNKTVWIIHIPKHLPRQPVFAHSVAWQRIEDSLVPMREERRAIILNEKVHVNDDWSAHLAPGANIHDLDPNAIQKAREEYKKKFPYKSEESNNWDDTTFLNKIKLTIKGQVTNAAILLLGKDESEHYLKPAIAKMTWILKDENNVEKDYEHFGPPLILNSEKLFGKIRNLTYRYLKDDTLFPTEIKMYEPYVIREALHNCIAHQDYSLSGIIRVVENPDELIFSNVGNFMPGSIETVVEQDAPQQIYRNGFLSTAMVNLNMIDTIGSGIKKMFEEQRNRFFPLPDFDLTQKDKVTVKIAGRIWDEKYTRLLMTKTNLNLKTVVLLDKVQKKQSLSDIEIKELRTLGLVEGHKRNLHISHQIAEKTGQKAEYIKHRGFKDQHYKDLVLEYLSKYNCASKSDIDKLLFDLLPAILDKKQKENKIRNLIYAMSKKDKTIINQGTNRNPVWEKLVS